jgi:hypothetical protein
MLIAALAIMAMLAPQAAKAQATRTWVSGVGDDANPCSRTAPCKTFAGAISKTAAGGEINTLDPGGFGGVTITKSITIRSDGVEAGVLVSGTNAIIISAGATDTVVLEGLDIEGLGTGLDGVRVITGQYVYINRCAIRRFSGNGVNMTSSTANARLFIKDSLILRNNVGVNVQGGGVANVATILGTVVDGNTSVGVQASGAGNIVAFVNSAVNGNATALSFTGGASSFSFGPSNVVTGPGSTFTTTNPFK